MRRLALLAGLLMVVVSCSRSVPNGNSWGDTGDGRYRNPVLAADYSDPDVIRVGDRFYMVASDFHFMGMQVLESEDLVNWKLISQIYRRFDLPGWDANAHYSGGSWAPSIRWHEGRFYVYFCTPEEGLFMSCAEDPAGSWSPLHCVKSVARWEDPCPFWDEDGNAYLGHSLKGAGPIIIHRMSPDGRELLDDGVTVYTGPTAEGTKIHRFGDWYYLSIPEGGVKVGWQTVLRSHDIYGPYERRIVLETGSTAVNGPHQGAIVDTPSGQWWFLHFQFQDPLGRVLHLQPMRWEDGWPVVGVDYDGNGVGEPVAEWEKPEVRRHTASFLPASSDDFSSDELGLQWQFNHNPVDSAWSLSSHPGALALRALPADCFKKARNTLSQKIMGFRGSYTVRLDLSEMAEGQFAGLACMGKENYLAGIRFSGGLRVLYFGDGEPMVSDGEGSLVAGGKGSLVSGGDGNDMGGSLNGESCCGGSDMCCSGNCPTVTDDEIWLRLDFDCRENIFQFSWSADGKTFIDLGSPFAAHFGFWKGARIALYSYSVVAPTCCVETVSSCSSATASSCGGTTVSSCGGTTVSSCSCNIIPTGTAIFDEFTYHRLD